MRDENLSLRKEVGKMGAKKWPIEWAIIATVFLSAGLGICITRIFIPDAEMTVLSVRWGALVLASFLAGVFIATFLHR